MKIQVLGSGCQKCETLAKMVEQALAETGVVAEVEKVKDLRAIMAMGVLMTPGLAIDGVVKVTGRVPTLAEIKGMIQ